MSERYDGELAIISHLMLIEERIDKIENRVIDLEAVLEQSSRQLGGALLRLEESIDRSEKQAEQSRQEWHRRWQEAEVRWERDPQEWDRRWQESKKRREEDRQKWEAKREKDRQEREAERVRDMKAWNKRWGDVVNIFGTLAEDILAPNMPRIARNSFGFMEIEDLDFIIRRYVRNKKNRQLRREFDVIVVGKDKVIINQTKVTAKIGYIDQFVEILEQILDYFPEYKEIIPILASLYIREDIINHLSRHKIYAMAMGDETRSILNFDQVQT